MPRAACHPGEVLALRWCDIRNDAAFVDRSLCQTSDGLIFKSAKTEKPRRIAGAGEIGWRKLRGEVERKALRDGFIVFCCIALDLVGILWAAL